MKFFSAEGPIYKFFSTFFQLVKINLLWLLCSIPIVTVGAATAAAYSITLKMIEGTEGYIARPFFSAFRDNLKRGIPLGVISLFATYVVFLDFQFYNGLEGNPVMFLIAGIVAIFIFFMSLIYAFPLTARYDNPVLRTLKLSFDISTKYFLKTLFLAFILAIEVCLFIWNRTLILIGIFIGPALIMYTVSWMAWEQFVNIERDNKS